MQSRFPAQLASAAGLELLPSFWAPQPQQEWGWPHREPQAHSTSSSSPASSPDSCSLSPSYLAAAPPPPGLRGKRGGRGRLGGGQRQSASQREKLRMRQLAKALHTLRRYLPASVAPAGQHLTKIETLRLTIRYIGHLSELLGLSEGALARRGAAALARACPLCPPGLGCCQARSPGLAPQAPAPEDSWPPLRSCLEPSSAPQTAASPEPLLGAPVAEAAAPWRVPAGSCPEVGGPAAAHPAPAEPLLLPAELAALGLCPQSLPEELVSFLEGFLPLASRD